MLNYIKSEFYRAIRSKEIHGVAIGLLGIVLALNLVLYLMSGLADFRYGITSFSYSMLVASPMLYCYVASAAAAMLYEADRRNGTLGNSIACGIPRLEILAGKCIVTLVTCLALLALTLPVYIGSAAALLPSSGPVTIGDMLMEIPAVSLAALASLILALVLLEAFDKVFHAVFTWIGIMIVFPKILLMAGMLLPLNTSFLLDAAMWMPANFFSAGMQVNMSQCIAIWDTAEGMGRCLVSGTAGILIFGGAGILLLRKKEI